MLRELCKEYGIEWERNRNFISERLPSLIKYYIFAPSNLPYGDEPGVMGWLKEAFHFRAIKTMIEFIILGFTGWGSI